MNSCQHYYSDEDESLKLGNYFTTNFRRWRKILAPTINSQNRNISFMSHDDR